MATTNLDPMADGLEALRWLTYERTGYTSARPWTVGMDMAEVSISLEDRQNGHPKEGDMIARSQSNHEDMWLINGPYFMKNYKTRR